MDFYQKTGKFALGSRLRRLSEQLTEQAAGVYALYGVDMQPKWFPVFYVLSSGEEKTISQIAQEIGHSHPSVSTIVKEMEKRGVVNKGGNKRDKRENYVKLSDKGLELNIRMKAQLTDVEAAVETALSETHNDIWKAIEEWEYLLGEKNLLKRVQHERKIRESKQVTIVDYRPEFKTVFKELNEPWITRYFKMEASDYKYLDHPEENIMEKGGQILFALYNDKPVGTCALVKIDGDTAELAKMAVSDEVQGKGVGYLLGIAAIEKAKDMGVKRLYLESNTILKPAISLYQKLGFKKVTITSSPYERANICMEIIL